MNYKDLVLEEHVKKLCFEEGTDQEGHGEVRETEDACRKFSQHGCVKGIGNIGVTRNGITQERYRD